MKLLISILSFVNIIQALPHKSSLTTDLSTHTKRDIAPSPEGSDWDGRPLGDPLPACADICYKANYCFNNFCMEPNQCYRTGSPDLGLVSLNFKGLGTKCTVFTDSKCSAYRSKNTQIVGDFDKLDAMWGDPKNLGAFRCVRMDLKNGVLQEGGQTT